MFKPSNTILIKLICIGIFFTVFSTLASAQDVDKNIKSPSSKAIKKTKPHNCVKNKKETKSKPNMKKNSVGKTTVPAKANPKQDNCQTNATEIKDEEVKPSDQGCQSPEQTDNKDKPTITEAKAAGTFDGDLRDLPNTKPVQQENPNREPPKTKPKVLKKNKVIKP